MTPGADRNAATTSALGEQARRPCRLAGWGRGALALSALSPGASGAVGVELAMVRHLRAFAEIQGSLAFARFEFPTQTITPRLGNLYGLVGVRVPF